MWGLQGEGGNEIKGHDSEERTDNSESREKGMGGRVK